MLPDLFEFLILLFVVVKCNIGGGNLHTAPKARAADSAELAADPVGSRSSFIRT